MRFLFEKVPKNAHLIHDLCFIFLFISFVSRNLSFYSEYLQGNAQHVRARSDGKIKFNEDLVHPTCTRHGHLSFICSMNLHVAIESKDCLHPQSFLIVQIDQCVESEQMIFGVILPRGWNDGVGPWIFFSPLLLHFA